MFPISLDLTQVSIMLVGNGSAAAKRLALLDSDNAANVRIFSLTPSNELRMAAGARLIERLPEPGDFETVQIVMISDLTEEAAARLAAIARARRILVNVEDQPHYCDFHFSSFTRRGDLLLTVSTGGASPALAKYINAWLEAGFGPQWEEITALIADQRKTWRKLGLGPQEIAELTNQLIDEQGWLPEHDTEKPGEPEKTNLKSLATRH